jgi:hypothetical protein
MSQPLRLSAFYRGAFGKWKRWSGIEAYDRYLANVFWGAHGLAKLTNWCRQCTTSLVMESNDIHDSDDIFDVGFPSNDWSWTDAPLAGQAEGYVRNWHRQRTTSLDPRLRSSPPLVQIGKQLLGMITGKCMTP